LTGDLALAARSGQAVTGASAGLGATPYVDEIPKIYLTIKRAVAKKATEKNLATVDILQLAALTPVD